MDINNFIIFFSSFAMFSGTYFIWFSRYNVLAHLNLGVLFVAYFVPLMLTSTLETFPEKLVSMYTIIMALGAIFYVCGLIVGARSNIFEKILKKPIFAKDEFYDLSNFKHNVIFLMVFIALFVTALSWAYVGMIPMFASDPISAKFFKGEYYEAYSKIALPYRLAQTVLITLFPIVVTLWVLTKKNAFLFCIILIVLFFSFALTRGLVLSGIITLVAILSTRKRFNTVIFIIIYIIIFSFGSAIYYIYSAMTGVAIFFYSQDSTVWSIIASGAPDISDQLQLLNAFEDHGQFTLGRTFFGGLIPSQFYWNPSAWSLYILNNTDNINDIASGGLRVPVALWGYFSFGWVGIAIIPFLSGLIFGASTKYIKKFITSENSLKSILALSFYSIVLSFFGTFYTMSMYNIPAFFILILLIYRFSFLK
ncbi:O-antigen polymerase [Janthinobacterium sp. RB2P8]|uniref:O-antigen polymerase n=1 Tax=Janthinobacterium sp. RB2P8 TaxID=3424191 RepID=UPI003F2834FE